MKNSKKNLFIASGLVLLVLIVLIFRDFFLISVVQPMALVLWAVYRLLASVHQQVYWVILILISLILIIRSLPPDRNIIIEQESTQNISSLEGFIHWHTLISQSLGFSGDRKMLRAELTQLLLSGISQIEHQDFGVIQNKFFNHELDIPENIYYFLLNDKNGQEKLFTKVKNRLYSTLPTWWREKIDPGSEFTRDQINQTINWIEKLLEINYEHTSNKTDAYN